MVKETENLTKKGEFCPHALPISGRSLKEMLGASWHWQVGINPRQISAISPMRSLQNRRAVHLLHAGHFIHSRKHTKELVKYSRKRVR